MTKALSRRRMLRGLGIGGVAIALPPLEAMIGRAQAARPKRFFVYHWPQGVPTSSWFPKEEGTGWTTTACLKPLEAFRGDIDVISGLTYKQIYQSEDAHGHAKAVFTGFKAARGPSVQHVAGKVLGAGTRFSQVLSGIYTSNGEGWWSYSAPGVRDPLEFNPVTLFNRLFTNVAGDPNAAAAAARRAKSVLDFVKTDAADLQRALGGEDRRRLDAHLEAVRELEKSATALGPSPGATCAVPPRPADPSYLVPSKAGEVHGKYDYSKIVEYTQLMLRLQVMAQRCDLTRVSFISLGPSQCYFTFPHLGIASDYHNVCHSGFNGEASVGPRIDDRNVAAEYYRKIAAHHMEQLAYLLGLLKANDGMGALLDDMALVALSDFGNGGVHEYTNVPAIAAGKAGGAPTRGRNVLAKDRCLTDLWTAALAAVGALGPGQKFGDPTLVTRPLEGLWA